MVNLSVVRGSGSDTFDSRSPTVAAYQKTKLNLRSQQVRPVGSCHHCHRDDSAKQGSCRLRI